MHTITRFSIRALKIVRLRVGLTLLGALVACSGDVNPMTGPSSNFFGTGTVTPTTVASITLNPPSVRSTLGTSMQLSAVAKDSNGDPLTGESLALSWTSSDPTIVAISSSGLAIDVGIGTATITATASDSVSGSATLTVVGAAAIAAIAVTPAQVKVGIGQATQFTATLRDSAGNVLTGRRVLWQSSNSSIMQVDTSGVGTSVSQGTVTISVASASVSSTVTAVISNMPAPVPSPPTPGTVSTLTVVSTTDTSATLAFTQVNDGLGNAASYDVRYAVAPLAWATATSVTRGSCSTPLAGTAVGSPLTCTLFGLTANTVHQFAVVAFRGSLNTNAVLGTPSNVASAATQLPPPPSGSYANQPAGYTRIAETTDGVLPWVGTTAGRASAWVNPKSLETLVSGASLPVSFPSGSALKHIIEAGTAAGNAEAGSDYAGFDLWNLGLPNSPTYGGPSDTEYSAFYLSTTFSVYGNGSTLELPGGGSGPGGMKFPGYMGVTNNNQDPSGSGPTQLIMGIVGANTTLTSPLTASEFTIGMYLQNGSASNWVQNLNLSKHIVLGQVHQMEVVATLGTNGGQNGTWDAWLDGVHVMSYNNIPFINSAYAAGGGGTGLAGFWGWQFSPWWGGSGGPNKTRDDAIYLGHTYISGLFLRSPQ